MAAGKDTWTLGRRWWLSIVLVAVLLLGACGDDDDDENEADTRPESTAAMTIYNASPAPGTPARGGLPQDADTATVSIVDGRLDPDDVEGHVGLPFVLTVHGDGATHTLEIEGLVASAEIKPEGDTLVQFTVAEGSEGEKTIRLDGEEAGVFRAQAAGGITD